VSASLDLVFGALADPTRRSMVRRLVDRGPESATVLARAFPMSRQAVVKHLQTLAAAGIVTPERAGREVRYRAKPDTLHAATRWIDDTGAAWDRRLERLERVTRAPRA
jgi:DNA-binding transcriptional ArsR family regulator